MGGRGPKPVAMAARMAAPVGVVSSTATSRPHVGTPSSRRTTAGDGLGRKPWAVRTVPVPVATDDAVTSSTPRTSSAAAVPTTSMIVSCDPTSWKWTCDGGRRWSRPSTSASAAKVASDRRATPGRSRASSTRPDDVGVGAHDDVVGDLHHRQGGRHPGPEHGLGSEPPAVKRQAFQEAQDLIEVGAGVEEAAERHVPGDPGEAVEPGQRRDRSVARPPSRR